MAQKVNNSEKLNFGKKRKGKAKKSAGKHDKKIKPSRGQGK